MVCQWYLVAWLPMNCHCADFGFLVLIWHLAGFTEEPIRACCGGGGPYNYNPGAACGSPGATVCRDPSAHVHWDGIHLTEAAYKYIADGWLSGLYAYPPVLDLLQ
jgi:hypothetical protein